jgi:hypothetical protein
MTSHHVGSPSISRLITTAFAQARIRNQPLYESWTRIAWRIGGLLPRSTLVMSVQRDGEIDLVLRGMEDDAAPETPEHDVDFSIHYRKMLSELWVGSMYETFRLLIDRKLGPDDDRFRELAHELRLLRIPLEKHEIAIDKQLKEQPLTMRAVPPNDDTRDYYTYSQTDPMKAHIMPCGVSARGSMMWRIIDLQSKQDHWIERQDLSDRIIEFWNRPRENDSKDGDAFIDEN